ncbi:DUF1684 domain-containing protein [Rhodococcus rhodochrous]|uniref:DUF1684 domain-containing protein n=1 Tax=Rhodococcus rhodochrous TaxID=1829 RepID=A0AAW4XGF3_RHORH|nr:DUF1684 domain-containing protein [Rhodococcus rhodochrous]MCD2112189.1 DUF1684 domain-containing protein [Rhodococcus rhodochrous]
MTATLDQFVDDWQRWHAERNDGLRQPLGWLSLTALHWLDETPTSFDEAPGRWHVDGESVLHEFDGETTTYEPVEGAPGLEAEFDRGFVEIIKRTGRFGEAGGPLRILFTDATSGVTTYPAARILQVEATAEDGTVTLDFTRAANLPCAFTDAATCPIAPPQNRLPFAVEAGERTPRVGESS